MSTEADARQKAAEQSTITVAAVRFLAEWCRDIEADLTIKRKTIEHVAKMIEGDDPTTPIPIGALFFISTEPPSPEAIEWARKAWAERHSPDTVFSFDDPSCPVPDLPEEK